MKVPFLDLKAHHEPLRAEISGAIQDVIDAAAFAGGPFVTQFEADFAAYCGCRYAIGVGSGTEALWLTLLALGIGPGDEVITVPNTFIATAEAITYCGARPVFVDVNEHSYTMDPAALEKSITPRTKAIIPVHLFGHPADTDPIWEVARQHGLFLVEDACQAHGAEYKGSKVGCLGDAGCFSFYPGKNLGAFGEAGAVVTNDPKLQEKIRMLRDHGQSRRYHHVMIGWNCRMDGIQAAVLRIKLRHLERANQLRRAHAAHYDRAFARVAEIIPPSEMAGVRHVYHIYALRIQHRDEVIRTLAARGIECGVHYPVPIHVQEAYRSIGYQAGAFPIAERLAREFISLPIFPELSTTDVEMIAHEVKEAVAASAIKRLEADKVPVLVRCYVDF